MEEDKYYAALNKYVFLKEVSVGPAGMLSKEDRVGFSILSYHFISPFSLSIMFYFVSFPHSLGWWGKALPKSTPFQKAGLDELDNSCT